MINALIIESEIQSSKLLEAYINRYCPYINIRAHLNCFSTADQWITKLAPELVFACIGKKIERFVKESKALLSSNCQVIFLSEKNKAQLAIARNYAFQVVTKPLQPVEFILSVNHALNCLIENQNRLNGIRTIEKVIAIPTVDGYEFLLTNNIIRCEGMQKYTKVITAGKSILVSSYNLGEFIKLLESKGFISTHRSHLINLQKIVRYHKEGTITMMDGSHVPLSRRRKDAFLDRILHL